MKLRHIVQSTLIIGALGVALAAPASAGQDHTAINHKVSTTSKSAHAGKQKTVVSKAHREQAYKARHKARKNYSYEATRRFR